MDGGKNLWREKRMIGTMWKEAKHSEVKPYK